MRGGRGNLRGVFQHFLLSLELNLRSKQAIAYGYLVPVLFLVAFGSVFRGETPALLGEMGQILTITILGGACFGLPTSLVAERERGIWRRYRLLPVPTSFLVGGVLAARLVIVISAVALQIALARLAYGTPFPAHLLLAAAGVFIVTASFLGLGLLIAALADDVPAVQAVGQCVFLPMILIGGVGIPLIALPVWAQRVSGFMPGRYAVDLLQLSYGKAPGNNEGYFNGLALAVIGVSAAVSGAKLFRWEAGRRISRSAWVWLGAALSAWIITGVAAALTGRLAPRQPPNAGYEAVSENQIAAITYDDLPGDAEFISRLSRPFNDGGEAEGVGPFAAKLRAWPPGRTSDAGQSTRNLLSIAVIADASRDQYEGEIARLVYNDLRSNLRDEQLCRVLAWIVLYPQEGTVITSAPELGLERQYTERFIRERTDLYARKFLGRLRGKIRD